MIQAVLDKLLSTAAADAADDSGGMYAVEYRADIAGQYVVCVFMEIKRLPGHRSVSWSTLSVIQTKSSYSVSGPVTAAPIFIFTFL